MISCCARAFAEQRCAHKNGCNFTSFVQVIYMRVRMYMYKF